MKRLILLAIFLSMASVAAGEVSVRVCLADGNTPLPPVDPNFPHVYPDIMVGTRLTIIVDSNVAEEWGGGLAVVDANMDYGLLSCRDSNDTSADCNESIFPAAGIGAIVNIRQEGPDPDIDGFSLYTGYMGIEVGDWFIIDYTATANGICKVGFYDYDGPGGIEYPEYYLEFSHVRTRDFNEDTKVDFADFAVLASYWLAPDCNDPNWCEGTDLNTDSNVDLYDFALFADYWHERTE